MKDKISKTDKTIKKTDDSIKIAKKKSYEETIVEAVYFQR